MPIPSVETTFFPILHVLSHGDLMAYKAMRQEVRRVHFNHLDSIDLAQFNKRGEPVLMNRIGWGKIYLHAAGFIRQPLRDTLEITDAGLGLAMTGTCHWVDLQSTAAWRQKFGGSWEIPENHR
mgnify:CR=1 FL=1|jgi:restriction system protein